MNEQEQADRLQAMAKDGLRMPWGSQGCTLACCTEDTSAWIHRADQIVKVNRWHLQVLLRARINQAHYSDDLQAKIDAFKNKIDLYQSELANILDEPIYGQGLGHPKWG